MTMMLTSDWKTAVSHWDAYKGVLKHRSALLHVYANDCPDEIWEVLINADGSICWADRKDRPAGWSPDTWSRLDAVEGYRWRDAHGLQVSLGTGCYELSALNQVFKRPGDPLGTWVSYNVAVEVAV